ncbi:MAG: hypothetical protein LBH93_07385 [Chitinispirillales bacterium]|jgi:hypothetical protein|nr:hypothetical protein [Chitinispirillales bacterium]
MNWRFLMKKVCFSLLAGIVVLSVAVGCVPPSTGHSTSSLAAIKMDGSLRDGKGIELEPRAHVVPHLVALKVDTLKVAGEASGLLANLASVKQNAIANALMLGQGDILKSSDVLVGVNFGYEYGDTTIRSTNTTKRVGKVKVTVTGYPARYARFRPMNVNDTITNIANGTAIEAPKIEPMAVPIGQP